MWVVLALGVVSLSLASPTCNAAFAALTGPVNATLPLAQSLASLWESNVQLYLLMFPTQSQPWSIWFQGYKDHMVQNALIAAQTQLLMPYLNVTTGRMLTSANDLRSNRQALCGEEYPDYLRDYLLSSVRVADSIDNGRASFYGRYPFLFGQLEYDQTAGLGLFAVRAAVRATNAALLQK